MFFIEWSSRPVTVATVLLTTDRMDGSTYVEPHPVGVRVLCLDRTYVAYQVELDYSQMPEVMG